MDIGTQRTRTAFVSHFAGVEKTFLTSNPSKISGEHCCLLSLACVDDDVTADHFAHLASLQPIERFGSMCLTRRRGRRRRVVRVPVRDAHKM